MLMADSGVPPDAATIAETQKLTTAHLASADDVINIPFNVLDRGDVPLVARGYRTESGNRLWCR